LGNVKTGRENIAYAIIFKSMEQKPVMPHDPAATAEGIHHHRRTTETN
jgi:hypothetical protein